MTIKITKSTSKISINGVTLMFDVVCDIVFLLF
jgi:hypothetical protein